MTLTVETGEGLANADSFASVEAADAYWATRVSAAWAAATTSDKERALVLATDYLNDMTRFPYRGQKASYAQALQWPRTGATEFGGQAIPDSVVPHALVRAACYLAPKALSADLWPVLARGGLVASRSVGPISISYRDDAPPHDVYLGVEAILGTLLRDRLADYDLSLWSGSSTDQHSFSIGMHDFPGTGGTDGTQGGGR